MEHLTDKEIIDFCHMYSDGGILDENNNIKPEMLNLSKKVNEHISKCDICKKKVRDLKNRVADNKDSIDETVTEDKKITAKEIVSSKSLEQTMEIPNLNNHDVGDISPFEISEEQVDYYTNNLDELDKSNYTPAQKEAYLRAIRRKQMKGRQLTLTNKSGGFADALILALITGFAGGVFTSIILMLCK